MQEKPKSKRYNLNKVEFHELPMLALAEVAKVGMFGGSKYDSHNWRKPCETSQHFNCSSRHWLKYMYGEENDQDSKCHHIAHAAWNALAELEKILTNNRIDDRYKDHEDLVEKFDEIFEIDEEQKNAIDRELKKKEDV